MSVVIGIGTEDRGDDVAGLLVARALRGRVPAGVTVLELGGDASALLGAWEGCARAVVVDAVRSGAPPGTVLRLDGARAGVAGGGAWSSHGVGLGAAIELAAALGRTPRRLTVVGIEGRSFDVGRRPGPAVLAAVGPAAAAALDAVTGCETGLSTDARAAVAPIGRPPRTDHDLHHA